MILSAISPTSILMFVGIIISITILSIVLYSALDRGPLQFAAMLGSLILICVLFVGLLAFGAWMYKEIRGIDYGHEEEMADHGFYRIRGPYRPVALPAPALPQLEQAAEVKPLDQRHRLLTELCLMTIRSKDYGPTSKRLMTADDAQAESKARNGQFADRNAWDKASKYGQECGYISHQTGIGLPQGMFVRPDKAGGETVGDLISVLVKATPALTSAISALPGVEK